MSDQEVVAEFNAVIMPWVEVPLKNGRSLVGFYLFSKLKMDSWGHAKKKVGDAVTAEGSFPIRSVFPSLNSDADDEQQKVFLSLTLEDVKRSIEDSYVYSIRDNAREYWHHGRTKKGILRAYPVEFDEWIRGGDLV